MSSLNRIILAGRIKSDVESRVSNSGDAFVRFQLEVDRPQRSDGLASQTDTFTVVAWRQVAEDATSLNRDEIAIIEGRIINRTSESEAGKRLYFTEIDAKSIVGVGSASKQSSNTTAMKKDDGFKDLTDSMIENKTATEVSESDFDFSMPDDVSSKGVDEDIEEEVPF